jgi:hypothetical protein
MLMLVASERVARKSRMRFAWLSWTPAQDAIHATSYLSASLRPAFRLSKFRIALKTRK